MKTAIQQHLIKCDSMNWFNLIKVEDIAFYDAKLDDAVEGFGYYSMGTGLDGAGLKALMAMRAGNKLPKLENFLQEKIRINHKNVYAYLKERFGKEPNEEQITNYIIRVIMHEGTHAGMGLEQLNMTERQTEYGAMVGQFPENTYYRIKTFLQHPAAEGQPLIPEFISEMFNLKPYAYSPMVDKLRNMIAFIDALTDDMKEPLKEEVREKLARLELKAIQDKKKPLLRETEVTDPIELLRRYGSENRELILQIFSRENHNLDGDTEKMAGAVTTTSAPAMFNKVVRGRKKRRDD